MKKDNIEIQSEDEQSNATLMLGMAIMLTLTLAVTGIITLIVILK